MQIVLLRHGKPNIRHDMRICAADLEAWIADYDAAGIDPAAPPPPEAINLLRGSALTVCSDLARSVESAAALGRPRPDLSEPLFREVGLPYASWRFPRLSILTWVALFRLMWVLGYARNAESAAAGRLRAEHCAGRLAELAARHGRVVFVGHGSLIWFIARHLRNAGWSGPQRSPRRYWDFGVYCLGDE